MEELKNQHQQEIEKYQKNLEKGKRLEDNEQSQLRISIRCFLADG